MAEDVKRILYQLALPFDPQKVHFRVGATNKKAWEKDKSLQKKGIALAYIDARDVMQRLDEVVGPQNWQCTYPHAGAKTCCELSLCLDGRWITKANGAGDTDTEGAKGAFSDAFKRAGVCWGIGQYLYGLGNSWVVLNDYWQIEKNMYEGLRDSLPKPPGTRDLVFGPLTKSDLTARLREFAGKLGKPDLDGDGLTWLLNEYQSELEQCERDMPAWWHGTPNSDNEGLNERIQNKVDELSSREAAQ